MSTNGQKRPIHHFLPHLFTALGAVFVVYISMVLMTPTTDHRVSSTTSLPAYAIEGTSGSGDVGACQVQKLDTSGDTFIDNIELAAFGACYQQYNRSSPYSVFWQCDLNNDHFVDSGDQDCAQTLSAASLRPTVLLPTPGTQAAPTPLAGAVGAVTKIRVRSNIFATNQTGSVQMQLAMSTANGPYTALPPKTFTIGQLHFTGGQEYEIELPFDTMAFPSGVNIKVIVCPPSGSSTTCSDPAYYTIQHLFALQQSTQTFTDDPSFSVSAADFPSSVTYLVLPGTSVPMTTTGAVTHAVTNPGNGTYPTTYAELASGTYTLWAVYQPRIDWGGTFYGDVGARAVTINFTLNRSTSNPPTTKMVTTTRLTVSPDATTYSTNVTLTATTTPATATGTTVFKDGSTVIGYGTLVDGIARFSTSSLSVGSHSLQAFYSGDDHNLSSNSAIVTRAVTTNSALIVLTSSLNPAAPGQTVAFSATLNPTSSTGTVTFKDGTTTIGAGTIASGVASYSTSALTAGAHSIRAYYSGDSHNAAATSGEINQVIIQPSTATIVPPPSIDLPSNNVLYYKLSTIAGTAIGATSVNLYLTGFGLNTTCRSKSSLNHEFSVPATAGTGRFYFSLPSDLCPGSYHLEAAGVNGTTKSALGQVNFGIQSADVTFTDIKPPTDGTTTVTLYLQVKGPVTAIKIVAFLGTSTIPNELGLATPFSGTTANYSLTFDAKQKLQTGKYTLAARTEGWDGVIRPSANTLVLEMKENAPISAETTPTTTPPATGTTTTPTTTVPTSDTQVAGSITALPTTAPAIPPTTVTTTPTKTDAREHGTVVPEKLVVKQLANVESPIVAKANTIKLNGVGPPDTVVTLYIYSDPIVVTTRTDANGNWTYTLDQSLGDGRHQVYVTITDDNGQVKEKSNPLSFFVKEAKAVSQNDFFTPTPTVRQSDTFLYYYIAMAGLIIAMAIGVVIYFRVGRTPKFRPS